MSISFPNNPVQGDTFNVNGLTYFYDGVKWKVQASLSAENITGLAEFVQKMLNEFRLEGGNAYAIFEPYLNLDGGFATSSYSIDDEISGGNSSIVFTVDDSIEGGFAPSSYIA